MHHEEEHVFDERRLFTEAEYLAALSLVLPPGEAAEAVAELLEDSAENRHYHTHVSEDVLDLLSLVSEDCAERVRLLNRDTMEQAAARRAKFRRKLKSAEEGLAD